MSYECKCCPFSRFPISHMFHFPICRMFYFPYFPFPICSIFHISHFPKCYIFHASHFPNSMFHFPYFPLPGLQQCSALSCEYRCHTTPQGGACFCPEGYIVANDSRSCVGKCWGECFPNYVHNHSVLLWSCYTDQSIVPFQVKHGSFRWL